MNKDVDMLIALQLWHCICTTTCLLLNTAWDVPCCLLYCRCAASLVSVALCFSRFHLLSNHCSGLHMNGHQWLVYSHMTQTGAQKRLSTVCNRLTLQLKRGASEGTFHVV